jgi:hypothetical protein
MGAVGRQVIADAQTLGPAPPMINSIVDFQYPRAPSTRVDTYVAPSTIVQDGT